MESDRSAAMPRFALLEHTGHPDDTAGRHFDLLLEDGDACRTWKLLVPPEPGGDAVAARELPRHRLAWLETVAGEVSGGRGVARRMDAGTYQLLSADALDLRSASELVVQLAGDNLRGRLHCRAITEGWSMRLD